MASERKGKANRICQLTEKVQVRSWLRVWLDLGLKHRKQDHLSISALLSLCGTVLGLLLVTLEALRSPRPPGVQVGTASLPQLHCSTYAHLIKSRTHSDWTSLGHMSIPEPITVPREICNTLIGGDLRRESRLDALWEGRDGCGRERSSGWDKPGMPCWLVPLREGRERCVTSWEGSTLGL